MRKSSLRILIATTATGLLAVLQENRLQLISNVSGKFVP